MWRKKGLPCNHCFWLFQELSNPLQAHRSLDSLSLPDYFPMQWFYWNNLDSAAESMIKSPTEAGSWCWSSDCFVSINWTLSPHSNAVHLHLWDNILLLWVQGSAEASATTIKTWNVITWNNDKHTWKGSIISKLRQVAWDSYQCHFLIKSTKHISRKVHSQIIKLFFFLILQSLCVPPPYTKANKGDFIVTLEITCFVTNSMAPYHDLIK